MITLALKSLWNRRFVAALTVLSVALSVALILGVERLRSDARDSFTNSASGIDLIVAARGDPVQILMATVFGVGSTTAAINWDSLKMVETLPGVAWAVPVSMGDNHRGFPVIGTNAAYFERFRHSGGKSLDFDAGGPFAAADSAVVGAEVGARFGYVPGAVIVNAHGAGSVAFDVHDEAPFTISGVLAPTGTAVDRMVFVSLEGFDALHAELEAPPADPFAVSALPDDDHEHAADADRPAGAPRAAEEHSGEGHDHQDAQHRNVPEETHDEHDRAHAHVEDDGDAHAGHHAHAPERINAVFIGLTDRTAVLGLQRAIQDYTIEPLTAVLPNVALLELWAITGTAERALLAMAWAVAVAGILCMITMLSATLETRRREFAILRSVGATPGHVFALIVTEAALLTISGLLLGFVLLAGATLIADPVLSSRFGIRMGLEPGARDAALVAAILCAGLLAALIPAIRVWRMTLADGLSPRL